MVVEQPARLPAARVEEEEASRRCAIDESPGCGLDDDPVGADDVAALDVKLAVFGHANLDCRRLDDASGTEAHKCCADGLDSLRPRHCVAHPPGPMTAIMRSEL